MHNLFINKYIMQASRFQGLNSGSSTSAIITLAVLFGFIVIMVIVARRGSARKKAGPGKGYYSMSNFKRISRKMGLEHYEIKILTELAGKNKIANPVAFLHNSTSLDTALKRAIEEIDSLGSEENVKENRKAMLFRIKQKIERNAQNKATFLGTHQLQINQPLAISPETGGRYQSKVVSNLKNNLSIQIPENNKGQQIRWPKSTKMKVFFWKRNGQGYSFSSKVMAYNTIRNLPCLFISHSNNIQQAQQRKYRRKELEKPAYFFPVRVITTGFGRGKQKKAYVDTRSNSLGTVIDISAGGCSLKSSYPLDHGELIKIEFETYKGSNITVFGKILSMHRIKPYGGIMHIRFTKVSRAHMNKINTYVYDIDIN